MLCSFCASINYVAILAASAAYFFIGFLWFSVLFGKMWQKELKKHNVTIKKPTTADMIQKMVLTFLGSVVTSVAMAVLVFATGSTTLESGLHLGLLVAFGFAATTMGVAYVWESRSIKLFVLDMGYPILGIIASAIILSIW